MRWSALIENPVTRSVLDFLFPPLCLGCGVFYDGDNLVCGRCEAGLAALAFEGTICAGCGAVMSASGRCPECGPAFWPLFAFGDYRPPLKEIILQFKFKGIVAPADWIAARLAPVVDRYRSEIEASALVPIPLHPRREHYRGYNQARVFAEALGKRLGLPVETELLARVRHRRPQARIDRRRREVNVHGVFETAD
ncbi:MAG TPA: double zinc ribbon domain-containing protein, partial [candidate division Zixibacteria bacterium]|nr:double zinc ribbon domain-containing protein [candidate division Zixibacteria bacterium]